MSDKDNKIKYINKQIKTNKLCDKNCQNLLKKLKV